LKKKIVFYILMIFAIKLFSVTDKNFDKMIGYYMLNDIRMAKVHYKIYFEKYTNAQLKRAFSILLKRNKEDANDRFFEYLQMRPRSVEGLVGYALSDVRKVKSTINDLKKASRLDVRSGIALLCIGNEYLKELDYPKAEKFFISADKLNNSIEYKIVHAFLYLQMKKPNKIIRLLKTEFVNNQTNFYVNYLLASAYFLKDDLISMEKHLDLLNGVGENKKKGDLLMAKYYIKKREFKKAKSILFQIKFNKYNEDYETALAITMMNLNNRKSLHYLYRVFDHNNWNSEINKQLGIYFYKRNKKNMVQNFIFRSLLSGISVERLKEYFSGVNFDVPDSYSKMQSFFQIFDLKWIDNDLIAVFARKNSGDKTAVFIVNTKKNRIIRRIELPVEEKGVFHKAFVSKTGNIIFSFFNYGNNTMVIYSLAKRRNNFRFDRVIAIKSYLHENFISPSILVGFDKTGTVAYITDGGLNEIAFSSPFLVKWSLTNVKPVYPKFPFDVIKYNFTTGEAFKILNTNQLASTPIEDVRKYFLIAQAYIGNSDVKNLIINGQKMDITSPNKVYTFFDDELQAFIIYIKGAEDSFKAILYNSDNNSIKLSESMFLGNKILNETIELQLFKLDTNGKNIFVMRKDTNQLIRFNYKSLLFTYLNKNVKQLFYSKEEDLYYSLLKKGSVSGVKNTSIVVFTVNPFMIIKEYKRNDIIKMKKNKTDGKIYFITRNGEKLELDDFGKFKYIRPSFDGVISAVSNDKKKEAVFINGRLLVVEKKETRRKADKKKND